MWKVLVAALGLGCAANAAEVRLEPQSLQLVDGRAELDDYRGRGALYLLPPPGGETADGAMMAIVPGTDLRDGTIEVDVAGEPRPGAAANMRGFVGVAFRVQGQGSPAELLYIRPTNGRSGDQAERNHATQYISMPAFGWKRLRAESPSVYESYVDLEAGAWTHLKIVVAGVTAKLYVNGAAQPCLIVNDLKLGDGHGLVGLWAHDTTIAHFANLVVSRH